jgi:hypothetical protein
MKNIAVIQWKVKSQKSKVKYEIRKLQKFENRKQNIENRKNGKRNIKTVSFILIISCNDIRK